MSDVSLPHFKHWNCGSYWSARPGFAAPFKQSNTSARHVLLQTQTIPMYAAGCMSHVDNFLLYFSHCNVCTTPASPHHPHLPVNTNTLVVKVGGGGGGGGGCSPSIIKSWMRHCIEYNHTDLFTGVNMIVHWQLRPLLIFPESNVIRPFPVQCDQSVVACSW